EPQHDLGFDRPIYVQYFDYLVKVLNGDLGTSIVTKRPVLGEFFKLFPATLEISLCAIIIAVCLGVHAGVFAAVKRGT
ncbi:peptide ABC transporter permease, partial [Rhizobium ruizarguesonis]